MTDEELMRTALAEAKLAAALGEVPVGAVVAKDGEIIAHAHNLRESGKNATYHAELLAIDAACKALGGWRLWQCELFVTLEPCPMCSGAIINSRLKRVVYGARDPKAGCCGSLTDLFALPFNHHPVIESGLLEDEAQALLQDFFVMLREKRKKKFGGWINAIIPVLIVPYYSVIGGWVIKYLIEYVKGNGTKLAADGYFSEFISNGASTEICFVIFCMFTLSIIYAGVRNGIERVSKFMMPILVVLSVIIAIYSVTRPGAIEGVKYFLVPNLKNFSWMTVVAAMGQMFYSLSIAMGILITFGSYMKKDSSIEDSTRNVEVFDTAIAIMAGLMIIPAVFAFSGGDPDTLQAGPALMFITIPKVFASMGFGTFAGVMFFLLVLFAALTSSIALTESAVSTFEDELGWSRKKSTVLCGVIMIALGSLSSLGYGPLENVKIIGMQFLDFFDFLTNSVMMLIAAIATCLFY